MIGCLVVGVLVLILFALVPWYLWPVLIVVLIVAFVVAAALGLLKGVFAVLFGRR